MKRRKDIQDIAEEFEGGFFSALKIAVWGIGISFFAVLFLTNEVNPRSAEFFSTVWSWISTVWSWIWYFLSWGLYLILGAVLVILLVFLVAGLRGVVEVWVGAGSRAKLENEKKRKRRQQGAIGAGWTYEEPEDE